MDILALKGLTSTYINCTKTKNKRPGYFFLTKINKVSGEKFNHLCLVTPENTRTNSISN